MPSRQRQPRADPPPYRGDVWDVAFPHIGEHPAIAVTTNALRGRLSSLTVVLVTGTKGPPATHVELDESAGLTRYPVSYANVTDLHTVPVARCRRFRGRVSLGEMAKLEAALALVLGLPMGTT